MKSEPSDVLNAYFITLVPFPHGLAQTNRLIAMAGGLVKAGCKVKVICLKPTENTSNSLNTQSSGIYNDIPFAYPSGTTFRSKNLLTNFYLFSKGILNASSQLIRENRKQKINCLFMGVSGFFIYLWFFILCKILHIKFLQERSEYPFIKAKKSVFDNLSLFIYLTVVCKFFDGFLVITHKLRDYFVPHLRKNCPVYHLPILVEHERFNHSSEVAPEPYIAYCGSMQGDKDGVPILIDAFKTLSFEYPDIKLYLIGSTNFAGFNKLEERISQVHLEKSIVFTGVIDREKLPDMLSKAVMLALARPENKQAEGGFPTKLGEYLATGKPVVVTNVGEISVFLKNNVNAFIARPGDAKDFADKMKLVLEDYPQALNVGQAGQELAKTTFSSAYQGELLAKWLLKL
jgi:glycosyltransferase involved in cell wall biosynthesis